MSDRTRRPALIVAAAIVAATAVLLTTLGRPDRSTAPDEGGAPPGDRAPRASTRKTVIVPPALTATATPAASPTADARAAERQVKRFVRAFLRYETGDLGKEVKRELRALATPQLARQLVSEPPRQPAGAKRPRLGRLVGLRSERATPADTASFTAKLEYPDTSGTLRITVARRGGRWRITSVR